MDTCLDRRLKFHCPKLGPERGEGIKYLGYNLLRIMINTFFDMFCDFSVSAQVQNIKAFTSVKAY